MPVTGTVPVPDAPPLLIHTPARQIWVPEHTLPMPPQLKLSVRRSRVPERRPPVLRSADPEPVPRTPSNRPVLTEAAVPFASPPTTAGSKPPLDALPLPTSPVTRSGTRLLMLPLLMLLMSCGSTAAKPPAAVTFVVVFAPVAFTEPPTLRSPAAPPTVEPPRRPSMTPGMTAGRLTALTLASRSGMRPPDPAVPFPSRPSMRSGMI